jgi:hypothetical protein
MQHATEGQDRVRDIETETDADTDAYTDTDTDTDTDTGTDISELARNKGTHANGKWNQCRDQSTRTSAVAGLGCVHRARRPAQTYEQEPLFPIYNLRSLTRPAAPITSPPLLPSMSQSHECQ